MNTPTNETDLSVNVAEPVSETTPETAEDGAEPARKPRHGDKTAAREEKNKRLEAALRNNLRRRKSQSRARKD